MKSAAVHNLLLSELAQHKLAISSQAVSELVYFRGHNERDCPYLAIPTYNCDQTRVTVVSEGLSTPTFSYRKPLKPGELTVETLCASAPLVPATQLGESRRTRANGVNAG